MRVIAPFKANVEIVKREGSSHAHYRNLIVCARIWQCPVCASTITENRRKELTMAIATSGYFPILITFTLSHKKPDKLLVLLDALLGAYRVYKSGRAFQSFKSEYGWLGSVRSLEVTHGKNGWHPHLHEVALLDTPLTSAVESGISLFSKKRWTQTLAKQGFSASWEHGVDVRTGDNDVTEYVAKFGRIPTGARWSIEHELTKAPSKRGNADGRTPMQLLIDYGDGDTQAGHLFVEYSRAFKGRNQLVWSHGLRELLGLGGEKSDEQIAQEQSESGRLLATITRQQWKVILGAGCRAELLNMATSASETDVFLYIASLLEPDHGSDPA